ncbi:GxxExxY protein [Candidatus Microgenomates bacterium]|nr:GxxExxY protein [Candidatus Microgenomates bacterium]
MQDKAFSGDKVIYPELSYEIMGCIFDVYNEVGHGFSEKHYYGAIEKAFVAKGFLCKKQVYAKLVYDNNIVGKFFLDFLINDKIVVELKIGEYYGRKNIDQVYQYLRVNDLRLGILVNFTRSGVRYKRIVNIV